MLKLLYVLFLYSYLVNYDHCAWNQKATESKTGLPWSNNPVPENGPLGWAAEVWDKIRIS